MMEEAGQKLKRARERLGLRFREVEEASGRIAARHHNEEYIVALSRLADIENKGTVPSMFRLYSLCAIYRLDMCEVMSWYGISHSKLPGDSDVIQHARTHAIGFKPEDGEVQAPLAIEPWLDPTRTGFLSRQIQKWGTLPLMLLENVDLKNLRYGHVGTDDWSMYPIIPPGALLVIDETRRRIPLSGWADEFQRPIFFLEYRDGYLCGWCTLRDNQLTVVFHPRSGREPETYLWPDEIEIIGQVMRVAGDLDLGPPPRS